ncbi:MAG: GH92 family glycosyl hydrolase [Bacteroidota bacterium]|nr:GH92 family glycosyl hydrolase [Bacteroidota bacterium]
MMENKIYPVKFHIEFLIIIFLSCFVSKANSSLNKLNRKENIQKASFAFGFKNNFQRLGLIKTRTPENPPVKNKFLFRWVDPFIGVENDGNVLPGTSLPFSFVRLGPDVPVPHPTTGYLSDKPIKGFSHTHVSGTGGNGQYGNISVLPTTGELNVTDNASDKSDEFASAGYYRTTLNRYHIKVELTQSQEVGFHRYTFPSSKESHILIDVGSMIKKNGQYLRNIQTRAIFVNNHSVEGYGECAGSWGHGYPYRVYFYAELNRDAEAIGIWNGDTVSVSRKILEGKDGGVFFSFSTHQNEIVCLKVGISPLGIEKAKENLDEQIPHWNFNQIKERAEKKWESYLTRIKVQGGSDSERTIFYTSLYRVFIMPTDITGENPKWQSGEPAFWDYYCIWDTYRTANPLYLLIAPDQERRIIRSLLDIYRHNGWIPDAWITGHYAMQQGGTNADVLLADAIVKDLGGFDYSYAFKAMKDNAEKKSDKVGIYGRHKEYQELSFCPSDIRCGTSYTLEYAYDDFCIGQVAKTLNQKADEERYFRYSLNCYNLFYPEQRFFWAKTKDGIWADGFRPDFRLQHYQGGYFYEGTPYQYAFSVPHDMQGLIDRMGGKDEFLKKLDLLFDGNYYTQTNEPDIEFPYLYDYIGRPDKVADRVRKILKEDYNTTRGGLPGSDDSGCMTSWYIWGALGFYPVAGQDVYLIGSPIFRNAEISLEHGKKFLVIAHNVSDTNKYIQSAKLNGKPLNNTWFRHEDIKDGGKLELEMGAVYHGWGQNSTPPPSLSIQK